MFYIYTAKKYGVIGVVTEILRFCYNIFFVRTPRSCYAFFTPCVYLRLFYAYFTPFLRLFLLQHFYNSVTTIFLAQFVGFMPLLHILIFHFAQKLSILSLLQHLFMRN